MLKILIFLNCFVITNLLAFSAIAASGTYDEAQIKTIIGSDQSLIIPDGVSVTIDGTWDFTTDVPANFYIEVQGSGSLIFTGNGGSRSQILFSDNQGILIDDTSNSSAISNVDNGGNVRISIGSTTYKGNDFNAIITAGGVGAPVSPLPVEFGYVTATYENDAIIVDWSTISELDSDYFEILLSSNLREFESAGIVSAAGYSSNLLEYSYTFETEYNNVVYIQIKQFDFNGDFSKTSVIPVKIDSKARVNNIYPNPCQDYLMIFNNESDNIIVTDFDGNNVAINMISTNTINTSLLQQGVYYIIIDGEYHRFIVN